VKGEKPSPILDGNSGIKIVKRKNKTRKRVHLKFTFRSGPAIFSLFNLSNKLIGLM
jgi:hypothetical protein